MKIENDIHEFHGKWLIKDNQMIEDDVAKKINYLKDNYLKKITTSQTGWEVLYQDPEDNRYWELYYGDSEIEGGGPPSLVSVDKIYVTKKYGNVP